MFKEAPVQSIALHPNYTTAMLRLDRLHAEISGNKWFKLKENLAFAKKQGINRILTFGGAFSNHIAATAAACKAIGFESIGVIRGQDSDLNNPTLQLAIRQGMQLHLVGRDQYLLKEDAAFIQNLQRLYGPFHLIPEGGNNLLGVMGCKDILQQRPFYDYVFCACGTGTTMAGLVAANTGAVVVGISVLKGRNQLPEAVQRLLIQASPNYTFQVFGNDILDRDFVNEHCILSTYAYSGYARYDQEVVGVKRHFEEQFGVPLDYVYTAKLMLGVKDLMEQQKIPVGARVLIIHSGGLQGNLGFEARYQAKLAR